MQRHQQQQQQQRQHCNRRHVYATPADAPEPGNNMRLSGGGKRSQPQIVRVPAATAAPLIVGSMPKVCNADSNGRRKSARALPMDTVHGVNGSSRALMSEQVRPLMPSGACCAAESCAPLCSSSSSAGDRVLIIVNDDHIRGGGVPIIGRRLASKSQRNDDHDDGHNSDAAAAAAATSGLLMGAPIAMEPYAGAVAGRRSHRRGRELDDLRALAEPSQRAQLASKLGRDYYNSHRYPFESVEAPPSESAARLVRLESSERSERRRQRRQSASLLVAQSSSCTSLCCRPPPQMSSSARDLCQLANCVTCCGGHPTAATAATMATMALDARAEAPLGAGASQHQMVRSQQTSASSRSRLGKGAERAYATHCEPGHSYYDEPMASAIGPLAGQQHWPQRKPPPPPLPALAKPSRGAQQVVEFGPRHESAAAAELRYASRNNKRPTSRQRLIEAEVEAEVAAVTHMYESLAAELKAKLGNPKAAPILLPPKDYDTLSRRQGKLEGIELRRSTNPQLVGPAATSAATSSEPRRQQVSKRDASTSTVATSSTPTTTMTTPPATGVKVQRSRSNSSSGLGSIVMTTTTTNSPASSAAGEPTPLESVSPSSSSSSSSSSSPSSSPSSRAQTSTSGASDSGHSGSGRMDISNDGRAEHLQRPHKKKTKEKCDQSHLLLMRANNIHCNNNNNNNDNDEVGASRKPVIQRYYLDEKHDARFTCTNDNQDTCTANDKQRYSHRQANERSDELSVEQARGRGIQNHNPSTVSNGVLWNGRVEIPLKVNSDKRSGQTYLATKQIIY